MKATLARGEDQRLRIDTRSARAWAHYTLSLQVAQRYRSACSLGAARPRPRVLVTGFGRFDGHPVNASGQLVCRLIDGLAHPATAALPVGAGDPPAPHIVAASGQLTLDGVGDVDVRALVLPVLWDLATVIVAREIDAFAPDVVIMNGVAGARQALWFELGAINRARKSHDASEQVMPFDDLLIDDAPLDDVRPNLASWDAVRSAAAQAIGACDASAAEPFDAVLTGALLMGARVDNCYLCNSVTYGVGYLMDHPGKAVRLLTASHPRPDHDDHLSVAIERDARAVPRMFLHWPSELCLGHIDSASAVLRAIIAAQLGAVSAASRAADALADVAAPRSC
jgi:pyrrolidone-carboxylate peptidase